MPRSSAKPSGSRTIGSVLVGQMPASWTGAVPSRTGSVAPLTACGLPAVPAVSAKEAKATEERMDRVASWPPLLQSCIADVEWSSTASEAGGWDGYPIRYRIAKELPADAGETAAIWLNCYREQCAPLDEQGLLQELLRLRQRVISRAQQGADTQLMLETWLEDLRPYPADMVIWALGYWGRNERFWPAWSEIHLLLERRVRQRQAVITALEEIVRREQEHPSE